MPEDVFATTPGQRSLWFMQQILPASAVYHIALAIRILSPIDADALRRALQTLADRHGSLRTVLGMNAAGRLVQRVKPCGPVQFETVDTRGLSSHLIDQAVTRAYREPFDLSAGPLFRSHLFTDGAARHLLLMTAHHVIFDVLSLDFVFNELLELYASARDGRLRPPRPPKASYRDFVEWQATMLEGDIGQAHFDYWRTELEGCSPILDLPTDRARPLQPSGRGGSFSFLIDSDLVDRLKAIAAERHAGLFDIFAAGAQALLSRYTGQTDVLVGFVTGGRPQLRFARTAGLFSNAIPLRARFDDNPTFDELIRRQRDTLARGLAHQDYPFQLLVERLRVPRTPGYMPLVQVLFNYFKMGRSSQLGELFVTGQGSVVVQSHAFAMQSYDLAQNDIEFDLTMEIAEGKRCWGRLRFDADLFELSTIGRMASHYLNFLRGAAADPSQRVSVISLLDDVERAQMIEAWNSTRADRPAVTVARLVEDQAAATPERIAVRCGKEQLTYVRLNERAAALAACLRQNGAQPGTLVGVSLERSIDMLVALLAVWKAGAAYVPLDPHFPKARLDLIVEDAAPSLIITESASAALFTSAPVSIIELDSTREQWTAARALAPPPETSGNDLAYVLYTSGSTGNPKGVEISHAAFANFLLSMRRKPGLTRDDVLLAVTTLSFDIAGLELFLPLITGACVVIATRQMTIDGRQLAQEMDACGATVMQATPATWRLLIDAGWAGRPSLKALCGGEALPRELVSNLLPRVGVLWNMYGPTETTVWSSLHRVTAEDDPVPIGGPIDNTTFYVLDRHLQPVPVGVSGELHIGGAGLARGYRHLPEMTAARFIDSPFAAGERVFKTGDLCRQRADGHVVYLGRLDDQVKLHGHRIELGDIESTLLRDPAIQDAVVVINEEAGSPKRLVAYLVPRTHAAAPTSTALRQLLSAHLPDYMIPSAFVYLDALPLTPNAKVDRKALRQMAVTATPSAAREHVAPRTPTERTIAALWAEMLNAPRVGATDRFDELGGDSLSFALMTIRAGNQLGIKIPVGMDDDWLTVAGFARAADRIAADRLAVSSGEASANASRTRRRRPEPLMKTWHGQLLVKTCAAVLRGLARVECVGFERVPTNGPAIFAGNHVSLFDFIILSSILSELEARGSVVPTFIIADNWRWLARHYASQFGHTIYVRRGKADTESLIAAREVLADNGTIAIMPEGHATHGRLARARPGVAYLSRVTGSPVWPIAIFGHNRILQFWPRLRRVPVTVRLGAPIHPHDGQYAATDFQAHADAIMRAIGSMMPAEYHGVYNDEFASLGS